MSNQSKSRKSVLLGILAVVVLLTMVLCGCNNEQAAPTTTAPVATGGEEGPAEVDLYWNIDRALYDGKSEAGMSSREPEDDGYFHVRFFKDGEIVELRVADRKTINALEVQDLMGLEFDQDGIVVGISSVDDLPIEQIAWQFYVQSVGGKLIKTNSSASMNGMEVLVETDENTGIYDMSGVTGEIGKIDKPSQGDRVMVIGDEEGNVTHVFVYERPNYMNSHEGECKHCNQTVTWLEWIKEGEFPTTTGHYQMNTDVTLKAQASMVEDAKICVDLNGHTIMRNGGRVISMHNAGVEFALMDSSEAKTGTVKVVGNTDQGGCVWVRYGVFYFYEGILDASEAVTTKNGTAVNMGNNTYMYMYGGEIIGGTSKPVSNGKGGWSAGISGTMQVNTGAKFVMNDGLIHKGYAVAVVTKKDANGQPSGYSAGVGGNIVINGGLMEMNGGTVRDGYARQSGNIHIQSKGELIMNGGLISNGQSYGKGANGGNVFVSANCNFTMNGGTIRNGKTFNCGGNLYLNGTVKMTDGIITDGKCLNWTTKEVNDAAASRNIFSVQGDFYMYGGRVAGGFQCIDSDGTKNETILLVSARSVIFDEDGTGPHLTLSDTSGGTKCIMYVGPMHDEGKIGVSRVQAAVFTEATNVNNTDNFISDIEGADIGWTEEGLVIGKVHCLCSSEPNATTHKPGCDEVQYAWAPWNSTTMPAGNANYYLTKDITLTGGVTIGDNVTCRVDLNGHAASLNSKYRIYSFLNAENSSLTITDTSAAQTGTIKKIWTSTTDYASNQGGIIWGGINNASYTSKNNTINLIAGTLDSSEYVVQQAGSVIALDGGNTVLNMYGGTIKGGQLVSKGDTNYHGGSVLVSAGNTFNMYGGTIQGGRAKGGCQGGNIAVRGTMNMYGGTIKDGDWDTASNDANVRVFNNGTYGEFYMYGGTIAGGVDYNSHGGPAVMYVSGSSVIDKSLTSSGCAVPNISLRGGTTYKGEFSPLQVGEMKAGASIYVTPNQAAFSNVTKQEYAQYFHAEAEGSNVAWIDDPANFGLTDADKGKLFIGHVHCLCGGAIESGTVLADGSVHTCKPVAFVPADSLGNINSNMSYYLTDDVTAYQLKMQGGYTFNLCLNGHNVTNGANSRFLRSMVYQTSDAATADSAVNITTCDANYVDGDTTKNTIKVTSTAATTQNGGVFLIDQGTATLYRGTLDASGFIVKDGKHGGAISLTGIGKFVQYPNTTIIGGYASTGSSAAHGGSVALNGANAVYTMLGGTIRDGFCHQWAGNVYIYTGVFNMYDGVIKNGCKKPATGDKAGVVDTPNLNGNITIRPTGTLNMYGGTIYGKITSATGKVTTVNISGDAKIIYNDAASGLVGNNLRTNDITPNIGAITEDARIGLFYEGDPAGAEIKVANVTDPASINLENFGLNVYFSGKGDRTFGLKLVEKEIYLYETTPVAP